MVDQSIVSICSASTKAPFVNSCDGDYEVDARHSHLVWTRPIVDVDNANGSIEFTLKTDRGAKSDQFFPIQLEFFSNISFCGIQVNLSLSLHCNVAVEHTKRTPLQVPNSDEAPVIR